jgi:hypothetical protein
VSFSGTYQYSDKFLNYQILTGGKIMLWKKQSYYLVLYSWV